MNWLKKIFATIIAALTISSSASAEKISTVMHKLDVYSQDSGGTLIFSDSPEYVRKRFAIIFENMTSGTNVIDILAAA